MAAAAKTDEDIDPLISDVRAAVADEVGDRISGLTKIYKMNPVNPEKSRQSCQES